MKLILFIVTIAIFSGCSSKSVFSKIIEEKPLTEKEKIVKDVRNSEYNKPYANTDKVYQNLNGAIVAIADQLFNTNITNGKSVSIILTSFADLNQLNKTTTFGRLLGESMFNELHIRKFTVTDFRGQDAVSVNADGEFHITRDVDKLKDNIANIEYIVVGTYVKFEGQTVLINARILDSESGKIISTARIIYKPVDCSLFDICADKTDGINIVTDNCSKVKCPTQVCKEGICDNSDLY
ncbi:MAG: FlgO family outer membrane protein [Campylobacterota bacterium]|nr:FlgO family outer membrane protein [Campylobacterota bacterium]